MSELKYARYRNDTKLTHYLFRFPAKFHPPVLRRLLDSFSGDGDTVLDPFCGSGTLLVESLVHNRSAIGIDVDPVAVLVTRAKSTPIDPARLRRRFAPFQKEIARLRRSASEYDRLMWDDLASKAVDRFRGRYFIPQIPNLSHWFRTYVAIDLARLRNTILDAPVEPDVRRFFLVCFASIIRNSSNADPVPVSGLEVTAHMRRLDAAGRRIDPFELFERKVVREIRGMAELWERARDVKIQVRQGDASGGYPFVPAGSVQSIITSPPYNISVDYFRRHTLEMYWLGCVSSADERAKLAPKYLGRVGVRYRSARLRVKLDSKYLKTLIHHAEQISPRRARDLKHYAVSMSRALANMSRALVPGGRAVLVVGNAKWNGRTVRATRLIEDLARDQFEVTSRFSYHLKNRYMSYSRHNGANVNREYALVLQKRL